MDEFPEVPVDIVSRLLRVGECESLLSDRRLSSQLYTHCGGVSSTYMILYSIQSPQPALMTYQVLRPLLDAIPTYRLRLVASDSPFLTVFATVLRSTMESPDTLGSACHSLNLDAPVARGFSDEPIRDGWGNE